MYKHQLESSKARPTMCLADFLKIPVPLDPNKTDFLVYLEKLNLMLQTEAFNMKQEPTKEEECAISSVLPSVSALSQKLSFGGTLFTLICMEQCEDILLALLKLRKLTEEVCVFTTPDTNPLTWLVRAGQFDLCEKLIQAHLVGQKHITETLIDQIMKFSLRGIVFVRGLRISNLLEPAHITHINKLYPTVFSSTSSTKSQHRDPARAAAGLPKQPRVRLLNPPPSSVAQTPPSREGAKAPLSMSTDLELAMLEPGFFGLHEAPPD